MGEGLVFAAVFGFLTAVANDIFVHSEPEPKYEVAAGCVPSSPVKDGSGNDMVGVTSYDLGKCLRHVPKTYARLVPTSVETQQPIPGAVFKWVEPSQIPEQQARWARYVVNNNPLNIGPAQTGSYYDKGIIAVVEQKEF